MIINFKKYNKKQTASKEEYEKLARILSHSLDSLFVSVYA